MAFDRETKILKFLNFLKHKEKFAVLFVRLESILLFLLSWH